MRPGGAGEAAPRPAATVALLREGRDGPEVLLTHRPSTMAFGPGLHVFPGGAVEPGDARPDLVTRSALDPAACAAAWAGDLEPDAAVAVAVSAIRELFEESGVLLATRADGSEPDPAAVAAIRRSGEPFGDAVARLELVLRTDHLVAVSRWVTPPIGLARRYDARFFVAVLPAGAMVTTDDREVTAHAWLRPQAALEAMAGGRIELWPPTATTLQQLAPSRGLDDVRRHLAPLGPALPPELDVLGPALVRVRLHGAGGIPGATVNAYLVGRRRLVVVDPGDPNDAAVEAILAAAADRGATIAGVLLTAPVPDHAAGSTSVALRVGAPVLAAPGAVRVLSDGVEPLFDGRELDLADTPVRVLAAPGTHPDHLVFQLPEANALLTGDLDGRCARGIPEPMDERALATSRERIARLGPMVRHGAHAGTAD